MSSELEAQDDKRAAELYKLAADQGVAAAQCSLARLSLIHISEPTRPY